MNTAFVPTPALSRPASLSGANAFDDLTRLAARVCEAPVAAISVLNGDRVWYMAPFGYQLDYVAAHTAFDAQALATPGETLVVPNVLADERFATHPLVTAAPRIRAYAAAAIVAPNDRPFGCVCVMDLMPRAISTEQADALRVLARQITAQLELRRLQADLVQESAQRQALERKLESYQSRLDEALVRLNTESTIDALTGLPNRKAFEARIEEETYRARRYELPISLLLIEIDAFERQQSSLGHDASNELLQQLARHLRRGLRQSDMLSRRGSADFAVILPNTGFDGACTLAERIVKSAASAPWTSSAVSLSIGLSSQASQGANSAALLTEANQALAAVKQSGGNRSLHFTNAG